MRNGLAIAIGLWSLAALGAPARAEKLSLVTTAEREGLVGVRLLQPFDVELVVERDSAQAQSSAVAYTLVVPDGLVVVGEELLVESLLGLGSSREGLNLVFRCVTGPRVPVLRFRLVATRPVHGAVLALRPDARTNWLGVVNCRDQDFSKHDCPQDSLVVTAR
jgi:hypothetical protein